jgi:rubrerythrin
MSSKMGLEEALDIAMNAELKAQVFYAQAAVQVQDPRGRDLLNRLAAFEQYHYQKLSELARSLRDGEGFIGYEARTMEDVQPFRGSGEAAGVDVGDLGSEVEILTVAIGNEKVAHAQYQTLADQTEDPSGQAMFNRLAYEEEMHQRILEDEFYALSNQGVWGWSGMYGE